MAKTDVYSWRLSRARKSALEGAARAEQTSVAELLDRITDEWIQAERARAGDDDVEQQRIRAAANRFIGRIRGGDPRRAAQARLRVRTKLVPRRGR